MSRQVPKSITGFNGGALNIARAEPACTAQIAAFAIRWTEIELYLVQLVNGALGEAPRRYTCHVNFREGWRGCLFQGRFANYPMDDAQRWIFPTSRLPRRYAVRHQAWQGGEYYLPDDCRAGWSYSLPRFLTAP